MFALSFRFPAGRYHATPWGRNVNEADVAWPPEPWRLLRTLIATWWRKGDRARWSEDDLGRLIDTLAGSLPEFRLPEGVIHAHTRHYMPLGTLKKGRPETTLIFDAFIRLPRNATLVAAWPNVNLDEDGFAFASDLAAAVGYLGRAESWTECEALSEWEGEVNCCPLDSSAAPGEDRVQLLASRTPGDYAAIRKRALEEIKTRILAATKPPRTANALQKKLDKELRSRKRQAHTLPERLADALALDTADYQDRGWSRPPAAREILYTRAPEATPGVVAYSDRRHVVGRESAPTVARFLIAGRPLPRIEDAVKIGELMRRAALAQFGWLQDEVNKRRIPQAPLEISGRGADGKPLKNPEHGHAFWLPEDADGDGWIDHVIVFIAAGMNHSVRARLDRITRLWLPPQGRQDRGDAQAGSVKEWRLALEGFGRPSDFGEDARILGRSRRWRSVTPFLASGHLKASGYPGEVRRLLGRRGSDVSNLSVCALPTIDVGGAKRRAIHFHRFRSRGKERQPDTSGALLEIGFPRPILGPLALGYGSHFGLGLFAAVSDGRSQVR